MLNTNRLLVEEQMDQLTQNFPDSRDMTGMRYPFTQSHLEAILNTAQDAILAVDASQHVLLFNTMAQSMFGYSPDQVIGKHIEMLIPIRSRQNHNRLMDAYKNEPGNASQSMAQWRQINGMRSDGTEFPIMVSIARVSEGSGEPLMIATIRDKTNEREVEKALKHSRDVESKILKHHLNISANITHELKTPLNAIMGFAELFLINPDLFKDEAKALEYIQIIHQAGEGLKNKMNQFMKFSEAESGSREYFRETVNLASICTSIFKSLEGEASKHKVSLTLGDIVGIPEIIGDRSAIRTILFSMISNAIKFNVPEGKVEIQFIASEDDIMVSVCDTGIGIPKDQLEFLGQPFFRGNSAYNSKMSGVGLGLALSASIAKGIGAHINIQSNWGSGTIVHIKFPIRSDQSPNRDLI